jgi:hypothetical protein
LFPFLDFCILCNTMFYSFVEWDFHSPLALCLKISSHLSCFYILFNTIVPSKFFHNHTQKFHSFLYFLPLI